MHQDNLAQLIWNQLSYVSDAYNFLENICSQATVYIFGGIVRDYLNYTLKYIRDYDFVIQFNTNTHFNIPHYLKASSEINIIKNRFDGYKILFNDNITIDIWELENTWAIRHDGFPPKFDKLIDTVYLNIDSFAYSLTNEQFLGDCVERWNKLKKDNMLDIIYTAGPFEELNLLRAIVYMDKYQMHLSKKLKERFRQRSCQLDNFTTNLLYLQQSHFNKIIYSRNNLKRKILEILNN